MTRRGRATVVAALALLAVGVVGIGRGCSGPSAHSGPDGSVAGSPEPVPAAPPPPPPPPLAPLALLAEPPVSREFLAHRDPESRRLVFSVDLPADRDDLAGPLRIETTLDAELTEAIWGILDRGRIELGHVVVMDPDSGAVLAYVSTDPERFPPTRTYPAASLIKVVTTAAAMDAEPRVASQTCRYVGNQYRLSPQRVNPPRHGETVSIRRALAMSNNQCFAQLAVHRIGASALLDAIDRFGFLHPPAPGHEPGWTSDPEGDAYALGRLGSGLAGSHITPLHGAQLAATLADGVRRTPHWVAAVYDVGGQPLRLPVFPEPQRVMTEAMARELRDMLVDTTVSGTARRAFRTQRGALLQGIRVAGKTGSLSGPDPKGRYEWFVGVAPAEKPELAIAVVSVHGPLFWMKANQAAAEVLKVAFCPRGHCEAANARRFRESLPAFAHSQP
jgi:penicillin-binding protein A